MNHPTIEVRPEPDDPDRYWQVLVHLDQGGLASGETTYADAVADDELAGMVREAHAWAATR